MTKNIIKLCQNFLRRISYVIVSAVLSLTALFILLPATANAAQLTARKLTLSTSNPAASAATTSYTFNFTTATTATFQSFAAQICTTASGACTTPTGFLNSSSTFTSSTIAGTWAVSTATAGTLKATVSSGSASTTGGTAKNIIFGNVQNPTTTNQTFFARMTLYSDAAYTTPVDTGIVAASTATQINLTGVMDESLTFCTGTSITGQNCGTVAGSTVDFGTFSSAAASTGTSVMAASTNGVSGYAITINGATLTCVSCSGTPTIAALASQTASSVGTAQFGTNLVSNSSPSVGAAVSGTGTATATANYATTNQFRFVTGDSVASVAAPSNANTFTVSYLANVPGSQAAGTYTATMTYIATATF
jgi:hypothetical protein